jgi:hypothetical protein
MPLLTLLDVFLWLEQSQKTVLQILVPSANVHISIGKLDVALAVHLQVLDLSVIDRAIRKMNFTSNELVVVENAFEGSF